jgi:hypothetical protein
MPGIKDKIKTALAMMMIKDQKAQECDATKLN